MTTNLAFGNRSNPTQADVNRNGDDANDPDHLVVMRAIVSEDDGEDDTAEISRRAGASGDDAVRVGVNVYESC